jgi:hypothetical protein
MTEALTYRALAALPSGLQTLARAHARQHPADDLDDLIGELALALAELADRATDPARVYNRARSRLRRQTQDPAHYAIGIDDEHHDTAQDDEPSALRRRDVVREIAAQQRVTMRRAQQIIKQQLARAAQGDLFVAEGGVACI